MRPRRSCFIPPSPHPRSLVLDEREQFIFARVADDQLHVRQFADGLAFERRIAAGDDQLRSRVGPRHLAGQLAALAGRFAGHRATVQHAQVRLVRRLGQLVAGRGQLPAQGRHLGVVQPAAQRFQVNSHNE